MIHLNKNTLTSAQKIISENSLQNSFANLSKLIISYEERDYSRNVALMFPKGKFAFYSIQYKNLLKQKHDCF